MVQEAVFQADFTMYPKCLQSILQYNIWQGNISKIPWEYF